MCVCVRVCARVGFVLELRNIGALEELGRIISRVLQANAETGEVNGVAWIIQEMGSSLLSSVSLHLPASPRCEY